MNKKILISTSIVATVLIFLAYISIGFSGDQSNLEISNPASEFCIENGGTLEIIESVGMCTLSDGVQCEEWDYFKGMCPN